MRWHDSVAIDRANDTTRLCCSGRICGGALGIMNIFADLRHVEHPARRTDVRDVAGRNALGFASRAPSQAVELPGIDDVDIAAQRIGAPRTTVRGHAKAGPRVPADRAIGRAATRMTRPAISPTASTTRRRNVPVRRTANSRTARTRQACARTSKTGRFTVVDGNDTVHDRSARRLDRAPSPSPGRSDRNLLDKLRQRQGQDFAGEAVCLFEQHPGDRVRAIGVEQKNQARQRARPKRCAPTHGLWVPAAARWTCIASARWNNTQPVAMYLSPPLGMLPRCVCV